MRCTRLCTCTASSSRTIRWPQAVKGGRAADCNSRSSRCAALVHARQLPAPVSAAASAAPAPNNRPIPNNRMLSPRRVQLHRAVRGGQPAGRPPQPIQGCVLAPWKQSARLAWLGRSQPPWQASGRWPLTTLDQLARGAWTGAHVAWGGKRSHQAALNMLPETVSGKQDSPDASGQARYFIELQREPSLEPASAAAAATAARGGAGFSSIEDIGDDSHITGKSQYCSLHVA